MSTARVWSRRVLESEIARPLFLIVAVFVSALALTTVATICSVCDAAVVTLPTAQMPVLLL